MAKRRQNGEGTIYQRPNGLWVCEITLGYDKDNKRQKKTVSSMNLDKLKKKINDLKYLNDRKMLDAPDNIKLSEWLDFWLETYKKGQVKPTTYDMYYGVVSRYIKPNLGHYELNKINQIILQQTINKIADGGMSTSYLKQIKITLAQAFKKAIELNKIYKNPCDGLVIPQKLPRERVAFTVDEQKRFLTECNNSKSTYHNMFIFAFNTGMRLGEIQALTWDDLIDNDTAVSIGKTLVTVREYDERAEKRQRTIIGSSAKTDSSKRTVPLNKKAKLAVLNQRENNDKNSPFIFYSLSGTPVQKRNIYREFGKIKNNAKITSDVTFHSMRHSFATRLIEKGADIKTVSELLGHKSIQITLDIYGHVSGDLKNKTISLLD